MTYPFSGIIVRLKKIDATGQGDSGPGAELHVNLWDLKGSQYLDVGVMIDNIQCVDRLIIDLPWTVRHGSVVDLGRKLDNEKMLTAVFNDSVSYRSVSGENIASITLGSGAERTSFTLLRLGVNSIELERIDAGDYALTRVNVRIPGGIEVSEKRVYVRLRFRDVPRAVFITEFHQKDRNLLSSSAVTNLLDLRVNVRRGVPDELLLHDPLVKFPHISKIHVFVIVSRDTELPFHSENYKGCRSLEDEAIWNYYLGLPKEGNREDSIKGYVGYQWSVAGKNSNNTVKDLVALGRFVKTTSSTIKTYRFVVLMLYLGAIGSIAGNIVYSALNSVGDGASQYEPGFIYTEMASYLWLILGLSLIPVIIHIDAQSVRNMLSRSKRGSSKLLNSLKRWWAGI